MISQKSIYKIKLCRNTASENSDPYEFKMVLLGNGDLEDFFLFVRNFNITLEASGILQTDTKAQQIYKLVCGEALRQFDLMSADMESANPLTVEAILLVLGA